jgi:predicted phosphoribosyltransferase
MDTGGGRILERRLGAIGEGGVRVRNEDVLAAARISRDVLAASEARERAALERTAVGFRKDRPPIDVAGWTVVLVDDGVATGASARAGCQVVRARGAAGVVMAVPVAPSGWAETLGDAADSYVCPCTPRNFAGVGQFYEDFSQTSDMEVVDCLARADAAVARGAAGERLRLPGNGGAPREGVMCERLLIVGSHDPVVLGLNRQARARLRCPSDLAVVPGATHLFEEPGTLPAVACLAGEWFTRHMTPASDARTA